MKSYVIFSVICAFILAASAASAEYYTVDEGYAFVDIPCDSCACHYNCHHRVHHKKTHHRRHHRSSSCCSVPKQNVSISVYYVWPMVPSCGCSGDVWVRSNCGPCSRYESPVVESSDWDYYNYGPDMDMRTGDDVYDDPSLND